MKKVAMIIALVFSIACIAPAVAENGFYASEAIVIGWEISEEMGCRIIIVVDEDGEEWAFCEEDAFFCIGDVIVLRMADLSDEEREDEVVDVMLIDRCGEQGLVDWFENKGL